MADAPVLCPATVLTPGDLTITITVDSTPRSYLLHVPSAYQGNAPVPLILDFHAILASGADEESISPYPALVDPEGVIMAFPNGLSGPDGPAWDVGPCCVAGVDDVAFARAVVQQVEQLACIDPARVFAVGAVMGGGMAYYLGCNAADVFAGVSSAGFDLLQENVAACKPSRPITVISFRSPSDTLVPYAGGESSLVPGMAVTFLGAQKTFQTWASLDDCGPSPSPADSNGCSSYSNCAAGVIVTLCSTATGAPNAAVAWPTLMDHPKP
jgi:polyhydroxybutyrate depolymerase